jgi:hypothetical protein
MVPPVFGGMMGWRRKGRSAEGFVALFVLFVVGSVLGGAIDFAKRLWGRLQDATGGGEVGAGLIVMGSVGAILVVFWMMHKAKKTKRSDHRSRDPESMRPKPGRDPRPQQD